MSVDNVSRNNSNYSPFVITDVTFAHQYLALAIGGNAKERAYLCTPNAYHPVMISGMTVEATKLLATIANLPNNDNQAYYYIKLCRDYITSDGEKALYDDSHATVQATKRIVDLVKQKHRNTLYAV